MTSNVLVQSPCYYKPTDSSSPILFFFCPRSLLTYLLPELQPRVDLIHNDRIRVCLPVGTRLRHDLHRFDRQSIRTDKKEKTQIKRLDSHLGCSTGRSCPVAPIEQKSVHSKSIDVQTSVTTRRTKRLI